MKERVKECIRCGCTKPITEFRVKNVGGRTAKCHKCIRHAEKRAYEQKKKARNNHFLIHFGFEGP